MKSFVFYKEPPLLYVRLEVACDPVVVNNHRLGRSLAKSLGFCTDPMLSRTQQISERESNNLPDYKVSSFVK